jgi:hypothetical protein
VTSSPSFVGIPLTPALVTLSVELPSTLPLCLPIYCSTATLWLLCSSLLPTVSLFSIAQMPYYSYRWDCSPHRLSIAHYCLVSPVPLPVLRSIAPLLSFLGLFDCPIASLSSPFSLFCLFVACLLPLHLCCLSIVSSLHGALPCYYCIAIDLL